MTTPRRVYIETWGCQMNLHQSEGIAGTMHRAGYALVDRLEEADVVLFNGCMVRQKAEEKVYGRIGAVIEEKRRRPVLLGVGGCLGEIRKESLLARFPWIDFLFGTEDHGRLPRVVAAAEAEHAKIVSLPHPHCIDELPARRGRGVTAMLTITEGCSNFCSYCIVPYARGPMRSRAPERILAEAREAMAEGYRELLLLGQNVNSYGRDRPAYGSFADLLDALAVLGIDRIRFTSSHPRDMGQDVLDVMATRANVCNHIHLAGQSGSDRILAAMNRGYTVSDYIAIVDAARNTVPGINVTTDLIVGYPGETEEDFEETLALISRMKFGSVFVAKYSPRPLTRAAQSADDVSGAAKNDRLQRVLCLQRSIALKENEQFIGRTVEVLVEGTSRDGGWYGRADDHRTVVFQGAGQCGAFVSVRVAEASPSALLGEALVPEGAVQ